MSLSAGRVGVRADQVDSHGRVISPSFLNELVEDLPEWTDLPVRVNGTEQLIPSNPSVPVTSPILADIKYPDIRRNNQYFTYRESPTTVDGLAKIKSIRGNSIIWNQLAPTLASGNYHANRSTIAYSNNVATVTSNGNNGFGFYKEGTSTLVGHKYLFIAKVKPSKVGSLRLGLDEDTTVGNRFAFLDTNEKTLGRVWTCATANSPLVCYYYVDSEVSTSDNYTITNLMVIDLTLLGNSLISDYASFKNCFPLSYYSYNQGSLLNFNGTGIKTVGKNQLNYDEWKDVTTYNGTSVFENNGVTITSTGEDAFTNWNNTLFPADARVPVISGKKITMSWESSDTSIQGVAYIFPNGLIANNVSQDQRYGNSLSYTPKDGDEYVSFRFGVTPSGKTISYKNIMIRYDDADSSFEEYEENTTSLPTETYFPTGMKSAGSIYDEITGSKAITRVGQVDMGTLNWTYDSTVPRFITTDLANVIGHASASSVKGNATSIYEVVSFDTLYSVKANMTMAINTAGNISVINTAYTTPSAFRTAMSGVYLNYELATPIELPTLDFGE